MTAKVICVTLAMVISVSASYIGLKHLLFTFMCRNTYIYIHCNIFAVYLISPLLCLELVCLAVAHTLSQFNAYLG